MYSFYPEGNFEDGIKRKYANSYRHRENRGYEVDTYSSISKSFVHKGDKEFGFLALSKKFGVDKSTISSIYYNKTWRNIDEN